MDKIHAHEGSTAMHNRLRAFISAPNLRKACREYRCDKCRATRPDTDQLDNIKRLRKTQNDWKATQPFQRVHMDILGPFRQLDYLSALYVVTLVDSFTGYAIVKVTSRCPTSHDAAALVRKVVEFFNTLPEACHTDNGSQFMSTAFCGTLRDMSCQHVTSPVHARWCNGRVERFHRIINECVRAGSDEDSLTKEEFKKLVHQAVQHHNTAVYNSLNISAHELVFSYPAWIHPEISQYRRRFIFPADPQEGATVQALPRVLPKPGETWLCRRFTNLRKASRPFEKCLIHEKIHLLIYRVQVLETENIRNIHLKHLKSLTKSSAAFSSVGGGV